MHSRSNPPEERPTPSNQPGPDPTRTIPAVLGTAVDKLLSVELVWTLLASLLVLLSYLLDISPVLPWIGLALAFLPFPLRLVRSGTIRLRTSFDIPIALFLTGALIGFFTSPDRTISLGALQSILAFTLCYYSWVNYAHQATLIKWLVTVVPVVFLIVMLLFVLDLPKLATQPNFELGGYGTHHGLAMYLMIVAAVLSGIAVFSRHTRARIFAAAIFLTFLAIVLIMTWDSLTSLFRLDSISGRLPIWENTAAMLRHSPFTGLGLGCWALAYYGIPALDNEIVNEITHAHNAYLELYANTGVLGILALIVALVIGAKLSLDIIRSPRSHPWYGLGVGVILACIATLLVGIVESAPMGVPLAAAETYYYIISPIPWILCGLLVVAHRLITKGAAQ